MEKPCVGNADLAIVASMHHRFAELEASYVVPTERLPSVCASTNSKTDGSSGVRGCPESASGQELRFPALRERPVTRGLRLERFRLRSANKRRSGGSTLKRVPHRYQRLLHRAFFLPILPILSGLAIGSCRATPLCPHLQALPQAPHLWRGRYNG
jgi:hypothetical protein